MKYLRKITVVIIAVILFAAVAIGTGVAFAVRNVNVTYLNYGDETDEAVLEIKRAVLEKYRGTVIVFVGEDEVRACIPDGYVLESFEKVYPCTLNFSVKERREMFAVKSGDLYDIYDEDGLFLRSSENYYNLKDGAPDVILEGTDSVNLESMALAASAFKKNFHSLRSSVEKISEISAQTSFEESKCVFTLRCGLTIEVRNNGLLEEKLSRAAAVFATLSGEQKLGGTIYCYTAIDGSVRATYN